MIEDNRTEEKRDLALSGIFIAVGMRPQTALVKEVVEMENGYIRAGEDCRTNIPFLYAIGDVRTKTVRQIATAIGDGLCCDRVTRTRSAGIGQAGKS